MKGAARSLRATAAALSLLLPAAAAAEPLWQVGDGSAVGFVAYQSGAPVEGIFEKFSAEIVFDPENLEGSRATVRIDTASVNSQSKDRDDAIRSAGLLDVAQWPSALFETETFTRTGPEAFEAKGTLTLRDITQEVTLPFELRLSEAGDAWTAQATGKLRVWRLDYGVGQGVWKDTSVVSGDVDITFRIEASRPRK